MKLKLTHNEVVLRDLSISDLFVHSVTVIHISITHETSFKNLLFHLGSKKKFDQWVPFSTLSLGSTQGLS